MSEMSNEKKEMVMDVMAETARRCAYFRDL